MIRKDIQFITVHLTRCFFIYSTNSLIPIIFVAILRVWRINACAKLEFVCLYIDIVMSGNLFEFKSVKSLLVNYNNNEKKVSFIYTSEIISHVKLQTQYGNI